MRIQAKHIQMKNSLYSELYFLSIYSFTILNWLKVIKGEVVINLAVSGGRFFRLFIRFLIFELDSCKGAHKTSKRHIRSADI